MRDMFFVEKLENHSFCNVVRIYDYFEDNESCYLVMELCENGSLSDFIIYCIANKISIGESVFLF
jgi:serine/threonine protein kinase